MRSPESRARQEPAAADGRRERGVGRQHHHLAHQARAAQIPGDRPRFRRHSNRVRNGLSLGRVSIRLQLLIVALTTLILPWAGCQYARELENALRVSQENALESSAGTIALALSAQPARVFREAEDSRPFAEEQGDLYVFALRTRAAARWISRGLGRRGGSDAPADPGRLRRAPAGWVPPDRYLFLYLEVDEPHFVAEPADPDPDKDRFDRVDLTLEAARRLAGILFLCHAAPRPHRGTKDGHPGRRRRARANEPRIQAYWLADRRRLSPRGARAARAGGARVSGSKRARRARPQGGRLRADSARGGRLFMATSGLGELLATFIRTGTRATVSTPTASSSAVAGQPAGRAASRTPRGGTWYRRFVTVDTSSVAAAGVAPRPARAAKASTAALAGRPAAEWLRASAGAQDASVARRGADRRSTAKRAAPWCSSSRETSCLSLRDRALAHLFDLTLLATALAVVCSLSASRPSSACASGGCAQPPIPPWATTAKSASTCRNPAAPMRSAHCRAAFERLLGPPQRAHAVFAHPRRQAVA